MAELKYWLWLTTRKGLGAAGALTVLDHFTTPERAFYGEKEDFEPLLLPPFAKKSLLDKSMDEPNRILGDCDRLSMRVMTLQDADYPQRLRQIALPPVVLYIKGRTFRFDEEAAIAVVGMRKPSAASRRRAERFALELASKGALVVSGIAEGIDSCAVTGALKAGKPVVSLLAGGADLYFPRENRFLYDDVAAVGALISEYPPGTPHKGDHFKPRNRILSGLCLGVLAVECEPYGGTMLTVNHALEQGREVYALPVGLDEQCARGTNRLIHDQKARLVERVEDILEDFADLFPAKLAGNAPLPAETAMARLVERVEDILEDFADLFPAKLAGNAPLPAETAMARLSQETDKPREVRRSAGTSAAPTGTEPPPKREVVPREQQRSRFTDDQLDILAATAHAALSADEIVEKTQIPMRRALSALTMLQVDGCVEERPGRRFYAAVELE